MKQRETFTYTLTFLAWLRYMYFYETKRNIYIHAHFPGLVEVYLLLWNKEKHLHTRSLSWLGWGICTSMKQRQTLTYTLTFLAWLRYMYFYETKRNIYIHAHFPGSVEVYVILWNKDKHLPQPSQERERVCKCFSFFHRSTYTSTKPGTWACM
jgi:hypothetical protein